MEYKRDGKDCVYRCWSNMVVLTFALTIHETQGQTLSRIILLLGRLPGMNVGRITWSLLYVALSRTRKLSHVKLFPTGSSKYYHPMYFSHLLKLSMSANLKKWYRSYVDHCWDRNVLRKEHEKNVREVERRLERLGEESTKRLKWIELHSLLKRMGYKVTTRDRKMALFCKLKEHMLKRLLWKTSEDTKSTSRKGKRRLKRTADAAKVDSSQHPQPPSRLSKRLRVRKVSKDNHQVGRRSTQNRSTRKRRSGFADSPLKARTAKNNPGIKRKRLVSGKDSVSQNVNGKHKTGQSILVNTSLDLISQESQSHIFKGLKNLGNSCYFNSVVQCLLHCNTFRAAITTLPPRALRVDVVYHLQRLFVDMTTQGSFPFVTPTECLTAAMKIPECKNAGMRFNGAQQDASEFLVHLLEHFYQKFRPLADIFERQLSSTQTCQHCSYSSVTSEPFKLLTLPITSSHVDVSSTDIPRTYDLYALIDDFHRAQIISGRRCPHCDNLHSTAKTPAIITPPRVLVVHLSRFRGLEKINNFVRFPTELTIRSTIDGNDYQTVYGIKGLVIHKGSSIERGHYISYFGADEKWFKANDHSISIVRWQTVRRKQAYLLFYEQI